MSSAQVWLEYFSCQINCQSEDMQDENGSFLDFCEDNNNILKIIWNSDKLIILLNNVNYASCEWEQWIIYVSQ